jgi:PAS domain S-box-containing protein
MSVVVHSGREPDIRRLQALHQFLVSSGKFREPENVCNAAAESLLNATSADAAAIVLFDDDGVLRFKAWRGLSDEFRACAIRHSAWHRGESHAQPVVVPDVAAAQKVAIDQSALIREGMSAFATVPVASSEGLAGVILLCYAQQHECGPEEIEAAEIIATQIAQVVERRQREVFQERSAQLENQLLLLLEASGSLLGIPQSTGVLAKIVTLAQKFVSADAYGVWRRMPDSTWTLASSSGLSEDYLRSSFIDSTSSPNPPPVAPMMITDVRYEPLLSGRRDAHQREGVRSMLLVPLRIQGDVSGTVVFYWRTPRSFGEFEVRVARIIGNLAASALGTADLYDRELLLRKQAEAAERRASFLVQAGLVLASSLDYQQTLTSVARLAVPNFADWAAVDVLDEQGMLERVSVTHSDPEKVKIAYDLHRRYPPREEDGASRAMRTGKPMMVPSLSAEMIDLGARDAAHAQAVRQLDIRSFIVAPMVFGDRSLGAITFATAESGRAYGEADLQMAEELARRAAIAVQHARLHRNISASEERFRAIVNTTPECVKIVARDGSLLYMNDAGLQMMDAASAGDLLGRSVYELIAPESREIFRVFNETICRGEKGALEFEIIGLKGQRRQMYTQAVPFRTTDGATAHLGITLDVTQRKRAERAALLLSAIVDSSDDAIISKDLNGIITSWNKSAERLFGYTAAEAIGQPVATLLIPDDRQEEEPEILGRLRRGERVDHFETVRRRKDGSLFDISLTISPVKNAQGKVIGASKIARDITDRKRSETALLVSELRYRDAAERFRFMAESMPQKIFTARPDGGLDYFNEQWTEFTNLTYDQLRQSGLEQLLHPEDAEESTHQWSHSLETGEPFHCVHRFRRADGAYRWHLTRARAMRDSQERVSMWLGSSTEIHEQKLVEEELRRANSDLEQFAFSASHDLHEPLRSMSLFSELLSQRYAGTLDEDGQKFIRYIRAGATRMETLLRDLLEYTQVAKLDSVVEAADANQALEAALSDLTNLIAEAGAEIHAEPLPSLFVHQTHLQQLFQNIIGNAIKYRSPERTPTVRVSAERHKRQWQFTISDNGIGIDPEYKEEIFGLFKRLHTSDEYSGTGIGLAICYRIVDRYHGRIWVESEPGQGSTFRFTLPG